MRNTYPPFIARLLAHIDSPTASATDGASLAYILTELALREVAEGGPYTTVPGGTCADLDIGVNILIALYLRTYDVTLSNIEAFISAELATPGTLRSILDEETLSKVVELYSEPSTVQNTHDTSYTSALEGLEASVTETLNQLLDERFSSLPTAFATNARRVIERTIRGNQDKQMSLMPVFVRMALGTKGAQFTTRQLAELALSNVLFWTAFIIYDDFWDEDEAAEPQLLPVANFFARHYTHFFDTILPTESGFDTFFHELMDKLDAANGWEMVSCRLRVESTGVYLPDTLPAYEDFGIKFYPAAGHVFGPIAMLTMLGYSIDSQEVEGCIEYFRHYLIAMQLNDDAHDWKEDLARGNISTAVYLVLKAWNVAHPTRSTIDLEADMPELERLFWFEALVPLCESVQDHARLSRQALQSLSFIVNPQPLEQFIVRNETIAAEALTEQRRSVSFFNELSLRDLSPP